MDNGRRRSDRRVKDASIHRQQRGRCDRQQKEHAHSRGWTYSWLQRRRALTTLAGNGRSTRLPAVAAPSEEPKDRFLPEGLLLFYGPRGSLDAIAFESSWPRPLLRPPHDRNLLPRRYRRCGSCRPRSIPTRCCRQRNPEPPLGV